MSKKPLALLLPPLLALASCNDLSTVRTQDSGDQTMSSVERQLLSELNAARSVSRTCGTTVMPAASAVTWNGYLASAARHHAADMAARKFFSHTNPDGHGIKERAEAAGYTGWKELGENILAGEDVSVATQKWLESPSHCKTLMDPAFKEVGIGSVDQPGTPYGTYFVQDFGTR